MNATAGSITMGKDTFTITAIESRMGSDNEYLRRFRVERAGHAAHIVEVEVTDDGAPQDTTCDCKGFRFNESCSHVAAFDAYDEINPQFSYVW